MRPRIEQRAWRLFSEIGIVDLFLSLAYRRSGALETEIVEEGILAATAYLRPFIPDRIARRDILVS